MVGRAVHFNEAPSLSTGFDQKSVFYETIKSGPIHWLSQEAALDTQSVLPRCFCGVKPLDPEHADEVRNGIAFCYARCLKLHEENEKRVLARYAVPEGAVEYA